MVVVVMVVVGRDGVGSNGGWSVGSTKGNGWR